MKRSNQELVRSSLLLGVFLVVGAGAGCNGNKATNGIPPIVSNAGSTSTGFAGCAVPGGCNQNLAGIGAGGTISVGSGGIVAGRGGGTAIRTVVGGATAAGGSTAKGGRGGGSAGSGGVTGAAGSTTHGSSTCLKDNGTNDYSKAGPYQVTQKDGVDLASFLPSGSPTPTTYSIFYPTDMNDNCPHPIIAWGNGTSVTGPATYAFYQQNAASWGMVVIASDNPGTTNMCVGTGNYQKAGIDYLLAQNKDSSSPFYQKLSTRAGVSGHSQGAMGATVATQHPNAEALVQVEGGGLPKQGVAALMLSGTADDIVGTASPTQSYESSTGPAFLAIYTGADHIMTPTAGGLFQNNPGTIQFMRLYTAWFRCFLGDDDDACALFKGGDSCGICKDPNWDTLKSKNM